MNTYTQDRITSYLDTTKSYVPHSIYVATKKYETEAEHYYDDTSCKISWSRLLRSK